MKLLKVLAIASIGLLSACATTRSDYHDRDVAYLNRTNIVSYGAERAKVISPVFWSNPGKCSEIAFLKQASLQNAKIKNIIDIKMEQIDTHSTNSSYCEYSGLALSYESLSVEEAQEWNDMENLNTKKNLTTNSLEGKIPPNQEIKPPIWPYIWGSLSSVAALVILLVLI